MAKKKKDPSKLPGAFASRVFVGGSYKSAAAATGMPPRRMLNQLCGVILKANLHPVVADEFSVSDPEINVHHDAIFLLHACRLAIFELSEYSGAMMEIERSADFGTQCLVLHRDPAGEGWQLSRMLNSFVQQHHARIRLHGYIGVDDAKSAARNWINDMLRSGHAFI